MLFFIALVLSGTASALTWFRANQKLGQPGIIAVKIPGSVMMKINNLPERVLDFTSTNVPEPQTVLGYLPPDTSYAERRITGARRFSGARHDHLMGVDRTSIHNADYCPTAQGFSGKKKSVVAIPISGPQSYQLSVAR